MKIILINGPAGSGKDSLGFHLALKFGGQCYKLSTPLKMAAAAFFGITEDEVESRAWKDKIIMPQRPTSTGRDFLIALSEQVAKPLMGDDVFGNLLAKTLYIEYPDVAFITDSGFQSETDALRRHFGDDSVSCIQIHRHGGYTFEGDSREWVTAKRTLVCANNGENLDSFLLTGEALCRELLEDMVDA